ncbi:MAG: Fpg/Nei family DNA glycosylase [Sandaracinaceae bacterium]
MPEGDTLHRIARRMQPLVGERVEVLRLPRSTQPTAHLVGAAVERIEALGKNLLVRFTGGWVLHTHLRMNGRWRLRRRDGVGHAPLLPESVVYLATTGHEALCTSAPTVVLAREGSLRLDGLRGLGPDLLAPEVDLDAMARRLASAADRPLGVAVMDQRLVAGIGNIWKSEGLFACGLDPFAPVARFTHDELVAVLAHTRRAMLANVEGTIHRKALVPRTSGGRVTRLEARRGEPSFAVYERSGEPCLRCGGPIGRAKQGTRPTYWCPRCQPTREGTPRPTHGARP